MTNVTIANILAFGLLNPLFLWTGLGLVSVPIIIHILNRQRFRIVDWAAMEFLLRAMRKNRKRMKLEQWLLLAVRCLVVALIGLALARPLGGCSSSSVGANLAGRAGTNVFIIDNSYSTAYEGPHTQVHNADGTALPPAKTHLEQQKQMAKLLINTLSHGGESVAVITAAKPATAVIAKPGYNLEEAQSVIDRIEQSYAGTDMAGALQLATQTADEDPKSPSRNLYVFSDGTRSAWEGPQAEALHRLGPEVAKRYRVTHFNMTEGKQQWNQAAIDVHARDALVTTKFGSDLVATVQGFGVSPEATVQFYLDEAKLGSEKPIHPEPTSAPLSQKLLPGDIKLGGPHLFSAAIKPDGANDPLKLDNRRTRVIDVAAEVKVLIVEGQVSEKFGDSSGAFLKSALAPQAEDAGVLTTEQHSKTHVTAILGSEVDLRDRPLRDFRAIILCGVERLDEPAAKVLASFVRDGGALITFVGEHLNTENYNKVLLPLGLIPGRLVEKEDRRGTETSYVLDFNPKATNVHRYLQSFKSQENTGLDTARVNTFWKVDTSGNPAVEKVLSYIPAPVDQDKKPTGAVVGVKPLDTSKPPAITSQPLGQGVVVFCSTSASPKLDYDWQSLTAHGGTWVQLIHEVLAGAVGSRDAWMNLSAGQPLLIPSYVDVTEPKLLDENKLAIAIDPISEAGKPTVYKSRPLAKPGVYSLELKPNVIVPIAVNVAVDEADVRTVGNDAVRKSMGDIQMTMLGDDLPIESIVAAKEGNDLAETILVILLALLAVECIMAMRFGRYRRTEAARAPAVA